MITINADILKLAQVLSGKNDVRQYLNCINIKKCGAVWSSDGHRALIANDVYDSELDNDLLIMIDRKIAKSADTAVLDIDRKIITCKNKAGKTVGEYVFKIIELSDGVAYPDLNRILPKTEKLAIDSIAFDYRYIADFICLSTRYSAMKMSFYGNDRSILIEIPGMGYNHKIMLMPIRL
jgi:hypothetical protein